MIKDKSEKSGLLEIDLTGPDGNAFVLVAHARTLSRQLHLDFDDIKTEMMSSKDYEGLIDVFEKHFGEYVILYR
jgi:hypothetical protein